MTEFTVRRVIGGRASGPVLKTGQAINFTGAMCKPRNLLPGKKAVVRDDHHELYGQSIRDTVLLFPSAVGSMHTGLVILDLVNLGQGPAAMIVEQADSLLVSGIVLSEVWYGPSIPLVECSDSALFDALHDGMSVEVDADAERVRIQG
ncbi:MAG: DUF126 domain-containing protein [Pseudomonadota bacterium]